ncbi:amidase [Alteromonas mediterranea]|uniref:Amidase n=1 Tax=Alteromonas mediterranea (strain DSM 17117 / CIP 110805 / LMG 28347 / Deep ecotype) TaxID=1774373 RepID=F2G8H8_ALTMD|nr:amidase [Alteromonas mediterranea]AEA97747.1 amidase [Alteromonas mediterranea DE]CAH1203470.1 2-amino-5-chloromuconic acid deaminase [Alteromonas mediterranea]
MSSPFVIKPCDKHFEQAIENLNTYLGDSYSPDVSAHSKKSHAERRLDNGQDINTSLKGLGLAVKDLFHIKGLPTAAGNPDWQATHDIPQATNTCVATMLNAGASFKGKTITDELAYSLHGQNKHYAPLVNPVAPAHIPGGSSSGSAVAVSAHLADIGLGTDTGGSIRVPASYQGLWGLRTTHGLLPCDNMVALAPSFDTIGWMTRDLDTLQKVAHTCIDNTKQSTIKANPCFGIATPLFANTAHSSVCNKWLTELADNNRCVALTEEQLDLFKLQTAATFRILQGSEIWQQHGEWIETVQPDIAKDIMLRLAWCKTITTQDVTLAKAQQKVVIDHINALFNDFDVLVIPTTPGVAPRCDADETTLANDRNALLALTAIAGLAGLPQLHLPLFTLHNAPCGLSLVGKKGNDLALLALAKTLTTG